MSDNVKQKLFQIELIWNREFDWCAFSGLFGSLKDAVKLAEEIRDSGDGARVKKIRVVEVRTDKVVWNGYKYL